MQGSHPRFFSFFSLYSWFLTHNDIVSAGVIAAALSLHDHLCRQISITFLAYFLCRASICIFSIFLFCYSFHFTSCHFISFLTQPCHASCAIFFSFESASLSTECLVLNFLIMFQSTNFVFLLLCKILLFFPASDFVLRAHSFVFFILPKFCSHLYFPLLV